MTRILNLDTHQIDLHSHHVSIAIFNSRRANRRLRLAFRRAAIRVLPKSISSPAKAHSRLIHLPLLPKAQHSRSLLISPFQKAFSTSPVVRERSTIDELEEGRPAEHEFADEQGREGTPANFGEESSVAAAISSAQDAISNTASNVSEAVKQFAGVDGSDSQVSSDTSDGAISRPPASRSGSVTPAASPPSSSVYVGNLYFDVKESDLQTEFSQIGEIKSVKIIYDSRGLSKGYVSFHYRAASLIARQVRLHRICRLFLRSNRHREDGSAGFRGPTNDCSAHRQKAPLVFPAKPGARSSQPSNSNSIHRQYLLRDVRSRSQRPLPAGQECHRRACRCRSTNGPTSRVCPRGLCRRQERGKGGGIPQGQSHLRPKVSLGLQHE